MDYNINRFYNNAPRYVHVKDKSIDLDSKEFYETVYNSLYPYIKNIKHMGFIAGGSVANTIYNILFDENYPINDIDIFIDNHYMQQSDNYDKPARINEGYDLNSTIKSGYNIYNTFRDGIHNYIMTDRIFNHSIESYNDTILRFFDLNVCQAGIDIINQKLYVTNAFKESIETRQILACKYESTPHSLYPRAKKKLDTLKGFHCNLDEIYKISLLQLSSLNRYHVHKVNKYYNRIIYPIHPVARLSNINKYNLSDSIYNDCIRYFDPVCTLSLEDTGVDYDVDDRVMISVINESKYLDNWDKTYLGENASRIYDIIISNDYLWPLTHTPVSLVATVYHLYYNTNISNANRLWFDICINKYPYLFLIVLMMNNHYNINNISSSVLSYIDKTLQKHPELLFSYLSLNLFANFSCLTEWHYKIKNIKMILKNDYDYSISKYNTHGDAEYWVKDMQDILNKDIIDSEDFIGFLENKLSYVINNRHSDEHLDELDHLRRRPYDKIYEYIYSYSKYIQNNNIQLNTPLLNKVCIKHNGYTMKELLTNYELMAEGKFMHHCVGGYGYNIENNISRIFSITSPDNKRATLELGINNNKTAETKDRYYIKQLKGPFNADPDEDMKSNVYKFVDTYISANNNIKEPVQIGKNMEL